MYVAKKVEVSATGVEPRVPQNVRWRDQHGDDASIGAEHALVEGFVIEDVLLHFAEPEVCVVVKVAPFATKPAPLCHKGCAKVTDARPCQYSVPRRLRFFPTL